MTKFYTKIDLGNWMKDERWKDPTLAKKLTEMGTPISHTGVWYWRQGHTRPKQRKMLENLSKLVGFRAEIFFLTKSQEGRLEELSANYDKDQSLNILFD